MRKVPIAAFTAALTVTIAVGLQMPAALAAKPVNPLPINDPTTVSTAQSGYVFLTANQGQGNITTDYVWYPVDGGTAIDNPYVSVLQTPATPITNAVGMRVEDGYIYGIYNDTSAQTGQLIQIAYDGTNYVATPLGIPTTAGGAQLKAPSGTEPTGFDAATFGEGATADIMYLLARGGDTLYELDFGKLQGTCGTPKVPTPTCLPTLTMVPISPEITTDVADIFWLDGYLWGVYQQGCPGNGTNCGAWIIRLSDNGGPITPSTTAVKLDTFDINKTTTYVPKEDWSNHGYGSQWVYADGSFGFSASNGNKNNPAMVYRCKIGAPGVAAGGDPLITCGAPMAGPIYSQNINDGTTNGISTKISVVKKVNGVAAPDAASVNLSGTLNYSITVKNDGPGNATGWVLDDVIPAGGGTATIVASSISATTSATGSTAMCDPPVGTSLHCYTIDHPLQVGETVTITYQATTTDRTNFNTLCSLLNRVIVKAFAPADFVYSNATATVPDNLCTGVLPVVDIGVTKLVANATTKGTLAPTATAQAGQLVTFSITVDNGLSKTSEGDSKGWTLTDDIPAGLTNIAFTSPVYLTTNDNDFVDLSKVMCSITTTTSPSSLACNSTDNPLPLNDTITITYQATVAAVTAATTLTNIATVLETDPAQKLADDPADDTSQATLTVPYAPGPTVSPSPTPTPTPTPTQPVAGPMHTSTTGGSLTSGGSAAAAGMLFVLGAGLAIGMVRSRQYKAQHAA